MRSLGLIALLGMLAAEGAAAQQVYYGQTRGWTTTADYDAGRFLGCGAEISRDGGTWRIARDAPGAWQLIFAAPGNVGTSPVTLDIDRATFPYNRAEGDGTHVYVAVDYSSLEAVRRGNWMTVSFQGGASGTLSLAGTAAAILKVEECVAYAGQPSSGRGTAPSQGTSTTPRVGGSAPQPYAGGGACPDRMTHTSVEAGGAASAYFVNATNRALMIYWVDAYGEVSETAPLPANDGIVLDTTIGHAFFVRDFQGACYGGAIRVDGPAVRIDIR